MAFGEEGYNPFQAEHAQCNKCGKMIRGPHKDTVFPDHNVYAADKERVYTRDEAEAAGLRHNVSGTYCPECFTAQRAEWAADKEAAKKPKGSGLAPGRYVQVREGRRLAHEKHNKQLEDRRNYLEGQRTSEQEQQAAAERARQGYAQRAKDSARKVEGTG